MSLVVFGQLVDAEDGDDVLQVLVALQNLLHLARDFVVLVAEDARIENARRRGQRIDGRIDAELRDRPREVRCRVEMREGRGRSRVRVVVRGDVDRLNGRDRPFLGRRDPLLHLAHLAQQRRLVSDRRRHAAEQRRHFGARLREPEDVVDEQQHVLAFRIAEILRDRERRQADAQARARRLRHLPIHERRPRLARVVRIDHAALLKFVPEVVAFASAFTDAAEHRHTAVLQGDVVDQLHDDDGLADAGAAEEADLATLQIGLEKVDDLDAGFEHLEIGRLVLEGRRRAVNRPALLRLHRAVGKIHRLAEHVQHPPQRLGADRHGDRLAEVLGAHAALHAVGRLHRDGADPVLAQVLLDLGNDIDLPGLFRFGITRAARCRSPADGRPRTRRR